MFNYTEIFSLSSKFFNSTLKKIAHFFPELNISPSDYGKTLLPDFKADKEESTLEFLKLIKSIKAKGFTQNLLKELKRQRKKIKKNGLSPLLFINELTKLKNDHFKNDHFIESAFLEQQINFVSEKLNHNHHYMLENLRGDALYFLACFAEKKFNETNFNLFINFYNSYLEPEVQKQLFSIFNELIKNSASNAIDDIKKAHEKLADICDNFCQFKNIEKIKNQETSYDGIEKIFDENYHVSQIKISYKQQGLNRFFSWLVDSVSSLSDYTIQHPIQAAALIFYSQSAAASAFSTSTDHNKRYGQPGEILLQQTNTSVSVFDLPRIRVAPWGENRWTAVWDGYDSQSQYPSVWSATYDNQGNVISVPTPLHNTSIIALERRTPDITSSNTQTTVFYSVTTATFSTASIWYRSFNNSLPISNEIKFNQSPNVTIYNAEEVRALRLINNPKADIISVWKQSPPGETLMKNLIYGRMMALNGTFTSDDILLASVNPSGTLATFDATYLPNGGFVTNYHIYNSTDLIMLDYFNSEAQLVKQVRAAEIRFLSNPKSATLQNGNIITAYASKNTTNANTAIRAKIYDSLGNIVTNEFQINENIPNSNAKTPFILPLMNTNVTNGRGLFTFWTASVPGAPTVNHIAARVLNIEGAPLGDPVTLTQGMGVSNLNPAATELSNGDVALAWVRTPSNGGIKSNYFNILGLSQGLILNVPQTNYEYTEDTPFQAPSITVDAPYFLQYGNVTLSLNPPGSAIFSFTNPVNLTTIENSDSLSIYGLLSQMNAFFGNITLYPSENFDQNITLSINFDNGLHYPVSKDVTYAGISVNDPPVLIQSVNQINYGEFGSTRILDSNIQIQDDSILIRNATGSLSGNWLPAEDQLLFTHQNGLTSVFDSIKGILTILGNATRAIWQSSLQTGLGYSSSLNPTFPRAFNVSFSVTDEGGLVSTPLIYTIIVNQTEMITTGTTGTTSVITTATTGTTGTTSVITTATTGTTGTTSVITTATTGTTGTTSVITTATTGTTGTTSVIITTGTTGRVSTTEESTSTTSQIMSTGTSGTTSQTTSSIITTATTSLLSSTGEITTSGQEPVTTTAQATTEVITPLTTGILITTETATTTSVNVGTSETTTEVTPGQFENNDNLFESNQSDEVAPILGAVFGTLGGTAALIGVLFLIYKKYKYRIQNELNASLETGSTILYNSNLQTELNLLGSEVTEAAEEHRDVYMLLDRFELYSSVPEATAKQIFLQTGIQLEKVYEEGKYHIKPFLGAGNFGQLQLARALPDSYVAVKIIPETSIQASRREADIQNLFKKAQNILPLIASLMAKNHNNETVLYNFMPIAGFGNGEYLRHLLANLNKREIEQAKLWLQILIYTGKSLLNGMVEMHALKVVHLDFKQHNMVIDISGHVYIIDFGCAQKVTNINQIESANGDTRYFSEDRKCNARPEQMPFDGEKADLYAVGLTLLILAHGENFVASYAIHQAIAANSEHRKVIEQRLEKLSLESDFKNGSDSTTAQNLQKLFKQFKALLTILLSTNPKEIPSAKAALKKDVFHNKIVKISPDQTHLLFKKLKEVSESNARQPKTSLSLITTIETETEKNVYYHHGQKQTRVTDNTSGFFYNERSNATTTLSPQTTGTFVEKKEEAEIYYHNPSSHNSPHV